MARPIPLSMTPSVRVLASGLALTAVGLVLSACGTTSNFAPREGYQAPPAREPLRPNFPIAPPGPDLTGQLADPPPQSTAVPSEAPPSAAPSGGVTSQPLPPPGPVSSSALPPLAASPAPAYAPPPPAPPRTITTTTTVTSVSGRVVDVGGKPEIHTVKSGDTLTSIARKWDTSVKQLADDNDLEAPYALKLGQKIKGPARKAKAYVVGQGDTLFAISRRFGVTAGAIAQANDISTNATLRSGQRLELPEGYKDSGPVRRTVTNTVPAPAAATTTTTVAQAPAYTPPAYTPPAYTPPPPSAPVTTAAAPAPTPSRPVTTTTTTTTAPPRPGAAPVTTTTTTIRPATPPPAPATSMAAALPTDAGAMSDADIAAAGRGRFAWPLRGAVISGYGPMGTGQRNDGLNVRAASGESVKSAASGEVVYAGDQVPGFGNLVLVKHDGGWVTAYAHLARADVKMRQTVAQGQQIGTVGTSGGVPEPQLHFEVRYAPTVKDKARPIDPTLVLPR